ncbi:MAG: HNH endonuclease [Saprospiraceae bacterium]|nr:HNH endonuclease [Saprospiraceae bacterium]MCF8248682.1 HNH endonuclease [Saprospiraceae bacterium]MCF8278828.1 HNH endonuclease [Bacteroidales bacterium]MCF8310628.1 HNH endonuclease [Saprospiraceae bacterium]MCF8439187.1 HNH endonuclease [Saprospiraceae bacterium]
MPDKKIPAKLRKLVAERAFHRCEYCQSPASFAPGYFEVEHIYPISKGGQTVESNLAYACDGCNNPKSNKTASIDPVSGKLVPIFHPRNQNWNDHFAWSADSLQIGGISPIGRATIEALQLNRPPLVNLRRALFSIGIHPPSA